MEDLEVRLLELTSDHDWKKILQIGKCYSLVEKTRFSWAWPSEKCLNDLKEVLEKNGVQSILSIGCGSGLLEWILKETTGLPVSGIELGNSWWSSKFSAAKFIKLHFIIGDPSEQYLQDCATTANDFALLFCYFNYRSAFNKYIESFNGKVVIIVGPRNDCGIVTDPLPLNPQFCECDGCEWILDSAISVDVDDCNVVAVYKKEYLIKQ